MPGGNESAESGNASDADPGDASDADPGDASDADPGDASDAERVNEAGPGFAATIHDRADEEASAFEDFEDFGPEDMAVMTAEEWEAAFDPETWITGEELLDRVEADIASRVANRDVFARVERLPNPDRVVAYSEKGYAVVFSDGSVEGEGTVLRDVKPTVALCSMDEYDVPEPPEDDPLPGPADVPEESGELGNLMIQIVAAVQLLAGLALLGASVYLVVSDSSANVLVTFVAGLGFLVFGLFLLLLVANARLSDRFRAEEYRNRLRAVGIDSGEPPESLPSDLRQNLAEAAEDGDSSDAS